LLAALTIGPSALADKVLSTTSGTAIAHFDSPWATQIALWDSTTQCGPCSLSFYVDNSPLLILIADDDFTFDAGLTGQPILVESGTGFDNFAAFITENEGQMYGRIEGSVGNWTNPLIQLTLPATGKVPTAIGLTITGIEPEPIFRSVSEGRQIIESFNFHYSFDVIAYSVPEPSCLTMLLPIPHLLPNSRWRRQRGGKVSGTKSRIRS
jgi:hypothetical protein